MHKSFYPKLAADNIKKNQATYLPYLLTCTVTIALFYIMRSLSLNQGIVKMFGGGTISIAMWLGCIITGFFSAIFLFYTNSFLMRRRKREFGLFHVLGMEKKHIARVIGLETLYIGVISLAAGLLLGIALDKAMYLLIMKVLGHDITLGFHISAIALGSTVILYSGIFLILLVYSVTQIRSAKPIELLQSKSAGEREPKTKGIMAALGVICLAGGYVISVTSGDPASAVFLFFIAVMLVIVGTYFLFAAGSIALLKLLRKNKNYYYQTEHFTTLSGMLYRMKQNAVGLANICILSTMVLVMLSSTTSMMIGMNDMLNNRYPYGISVYAKGDGETDENRQLEVALRSIITDDGLSITDELTYSYLSVSAWQKGNEFISDAGDESTTAVKWSQLIFLPLADYNRIMGEHRTLAEGQALIYSAGTDFPYDTIKVGGRTLQIGGQLDDFSGAAPFASSAISAQFIVMKDMNEIRSLQFPQKNETGESVSLPIKTYFGLDMTASQDQQIEVYHKLVEQLFQKDHDLQVESRGANQDSFIALYGGLFFLSIFLGLLFLIATVLIIYYKQISEGYDDRERFQIMQKVGMSDGEIKRTIHSQIITVFFLPLITAGFHVAFAFPIISNILKVLNLNNTRLYIACTLGCFLAFALLYGIIYGVTAKAYYRIVSRKGQG